jgi:hypothetical protein
MYCTSDCIKQMHSSLKVKNKIDSAHYKKSTQKEIKMWKWANSKKGKNQSNLYTTSILGTLNFDP